jgi:hypothetical protein
MAKGKGMAGTEEREGDNKKAGKGRAGMTRWREKRRERVTA